MKTGVLRSVRIQNFKAIRNSGAVQLTPLTVLIGNNGSGKSSLLEALESYQTVVTQGLDIAMQQWRGFEHVRNNAVPHDWDARYRERLRQRNPLCFDITYRDGRRTLKAGMAVNASPTVDEIFIQSETVSLGNTKVVERYESGEVSISDKSTIPGGLTLADGQSVLDGLRSEESLIGTFVTAIPRWQFLLLNPDSMGAPRPQRRTGGAVQLARNGSNIAEYLLEIRKLDEAAYDGILETLLFVLPYAIDLQSVVTSELERAVYLQMTEGTFKVPGWLLSSGTLRVLALLAVLRHPNPPPLIVVEEIENGLDPRTINLLVEEMRAVVESGRSQIVLTTHSPYLLDLLTLSQIVLVERVEGQPVFTRPADQSSLAEWSRRFSPGQLYTMGRLRGDQE